MAGFGEIWGSKEIKYNTKIDLVRACVFSVALYACETWTLRKADRTALLVFEMYCYRWILHVKRLDKIRNSEIRRRLLVKEDLVQVVMRRKLSLFGHICRMENERKIKSVMLGSMDGKGKRGRPKREWLDDIREWC